MSDNRPGTPMQRIDGIWRPMPWDGGRDLRDWFAGLALMALVIEGEWSVTDDEAFARDAYTLAEAMCAERAKRYGAAPSGLNSEDEK